MFECKICNREFKTVTQLVSHLTHPKSKCKIIIKDYYDKYLKKRNEGICQFCGQETSFYGIVKGYPNITCKHCKNKDPETQLIRKKNRQKKKEQKKISSGYYELPIICEICKENNIDKRFKSKQGLSKHIPKIHKNSNIKMYYDKYLKKEDEGICPITGKQTNFKSIVNGYHKYYGKGTCSADKKIKQKKENTLIINYGVTNSGLVNKELSIKKYKITVNKRISLKNKRKELLFLLRKLTIDKTNKLQCQICGVIFPDFKKITTHIFKGHDISILEYYNLFFKKKNEGKCPISKLPTTFISLEKGYRIYHVGYQYSAPNVIKKIQLKRINSFRENILKKQDIYNIKILDINQLNKVTDLIDLQCNKCGYKYINRIYNIQLGYGKCPKCFPRNISISSQEKEISNYIKNIIGKENIFTSFIGLIKNENENNLEVDIFIPSKNIAIEYNGLYWHSELINKNPKNYHIYKTNECSKKNIQLIHIFEDEWIFKKSIVKSMIKYRLGNVDRKIHARKCQIKEISPQEKNKFLEENHIQGKDSSKIKLGAFYNNELVSVMTFAHGNISKGGNPKDKLTWELSRFASKLNCNIPGMASKLLSFFEKNYTWIKIFTYADLRWSVGKLYYNLGFDLINQSLPNYWYVKGQMRIHRFSLRKQPDEPKDIPEYILRHQQGYYRIWDCGNLKFSKLNDNYGDVYGS